MKEVRFLLQAYYELLHRLLEDHKAALIDLIEKMLPEEIERQNFGPFDTEKLTAYRQAGAAFVDERIEMYNPIGLHYLYDLTTTAEAFEMEMMTNWYDSRPEYQALLDWARSHAHDRMTDGALRRQAQQMVQECGAYPDRSIIAAYQSAPALNKLPDYLVACAVEQFIRSIFSSA